MSDPGEALVSCSRWEEIVGVLNAVNRGLPLEMRKRLHEVFTNYAASYGLQGAYERLNNRTVSQILTEYQPSTEPDVIASGEIDGMRYRLCKAPAKASADSECKQRDEEA